MSFGPSDESCWRLFSGQLKYRLFAAKCLLKTLQISSNHTHWSDDVTPKTVYIRSSKWRTSDRHSSMLIAIYFTDQWSYLLVLIYNVDSDKSRQWLLHWIRSAKLLCGFHAVSAVRRGIGSICRFAFLTTLAAAWSSTHLRNHSARFYIVQRKDSLLRYVFWTES